MWQNCYFSFDSKELIYEMFQQNGVTQERGNETPRNNLTRQKRVAKGNLITKEFYRIFDEVFTKWRKRHTENYAN